MIAVLAQNDFGDNIGDGLAGPVGLLIIVLMVIATVLLMRNMNARLRRLPERFPDHPDGPAARGIRQRDPDATPTGATPPGAPIADSGSVIENGRTDPGTADPSAR
jgi:hypothetical protein